MELLKYVNRSDFLTCPYDDNRKFVVPAIIGAVGAIAASQIANYNNSANSALAYNRQVEYNNWLLRHQQQMKVQDMRSAGLNPAFANGSQLGATPPPPSYQVLPSQPMDFNNLFLLGKQLAETKNLENDSKKKEAETNRQLIENEYLPQLMQGQIDVTFGDVKLKASQVKLNDEEARATAQKCINLQTEVERMNQQIVLDKQTVENLKIDYRIKLIEEFYKSREYEAIIDNLHAQSEYSRAQADDLVKTRLARLFNLYGTGTQAFSNAEYIDKLAKGVDIQNGRLAIDLEMDEEYKEWDKIIDMAGKVIGSVSDAANIFAKFTSKSSRNKAKGMPRKTSSVDPMSGYPFSE